MARIDNPTYTDDFSHVLAVTVAEVKEGETPKVKTLADKDRATLALTFGDKVWKGDISQAHPLAALLRSVCEAQGKKGAKPKQEGDSAAGATAAS